MLRQRGLAASFRCSRCPEAPIHTGIISLGRSTVPGGGKSVSDNAYPSKLDLPTRPASPRVSATHPRVSPVGDRPKPRRRPAGRQA